MRAGGRTESVADAKALERLPPVGREELVPGCDADRASSGGRDVEHWLERLHERHRRLRDDRLLLLIERPHVRRAARDHPLAERPGFARHGVRE